METETLNNAFSRKERASSRKERRQEAARPAKRFGIAVAVTVVLLNICAALSGIWDIANVWATLSLLIVAYPMWRFLDGRSRIETVPFFAVVSLIYGLYYGFSVFIPYDPYFRVADVPRQNIAEAAMLSCLGIGIMVAGFFMWPASTRIKGLPRLSMYWSERKAKVASIIFGIAGIGATLVLLTGAHSAAIQQPIFYISNLALVAIGILFYLQLQGRLAKGYLFALWGIFVPLYSLVQLASGSTFPIIRLSILLLLLYLAVRRTIPWRLALAAVVVGAAVIFPLMAFKHDYRATEWVTGKAEINSVGEALSGGIEFVGIAGESLTQGNRETYAEAVDIVVNRLDMLRLFGYVLERTPESVPFWGGETYSDATWKFVPRFLYPDKPNPFRGNEFGHRYELINEVDNTTAVNVSQMIEMYVNFGATGLVIGMFLLSQIYRFFSYMISHERAGEWWIVSGAVVFSGLANVESNFLGVFGGILYLTIFLFMMGFLVRSKQRQQEATKASSSG